MYDNGTEIKYQLHRIFWRNPCALALALVRATITLARKSDEITTFAKMVISYAATHLKPYG